VKKAIRVLFASLLFGTAALAGAQNAVRVQVPFDFQVSGKTLPAGTYTISPIFDRDPAVFRISGAQGQGPIAFMTSVKSLNQTGASLSFRRYGESYFLSGVTNGSGKFNIPRTKQELLAASKGSSGEVTVGSE
jgi:hypothetical protein